jgi:hypothetical protein
MREICDACRTKPAKHHVCEIRDGQQTTHDLCDDCFRACNGGTGGELPVLDGQACYYCGAPAQAAGSNMEWEQRARGERFHFTCFRCGLVYYEVVSASLADMPEGLSPDAQTEALVDLTSETDRLVREKVREQQA